MHVLLPSASAASTETNGCLQLLYQQPCQHTELREENLGSLTKLLKDPAVQVKNASQLTTYIIRLMTSRPGSGSEAGGSRGAMVNRVSGPVSGGLLRLGCGRGVGVGPQDGSMKWSEGGMKEGEG